MSFLKNLTAFLPLRKKEEKLEYFFAINIATEEVTAALWSIEGKDLKILDIASGQYSSLEEIISAADRLLDQVLGLKEVEPQKILFGIPHSWVHEGNLKEEYLKILRNLVKELELTPMAYVATSNALIHLLEKQEGVPVTAVLVGFENNNITVTVVRAGKIDGVKVVKRGDLVGVDIEKVLLTFTEVETLPSKILIYGTEAPALKSELLAFSWMSKLSFLHFPKIEILNNDIEIKSVCLAGASEIKPDVVFSKEALLVKEKTVLSQDKLVKANTEKIAVDDSTNFGFVIGDVAKEDPKLEIKEKDHENLTDIVDSVEDFATETVMTNQRPVEVDNLETSHKRQFNLKNLKTLFLPLGLIGILVLAVIGFVVFLKADIKVFVEPTILAEDAQIIADPNQKTVDEENKIIPGQV
ncbi:hypothetical protein HYU93_04915, partial [Candidatus Daviesbacteria bacterium]|nr:hypothetical protein [Candidatus Daviesbacteria bacterium]